MEGRTIVRFAFLAAFRNTKIPLPQILITHHISLTLSGAEYLVQMNNGRIALKGPVSELDKADITSELVEKAEEEDIDAVIEDEEGVAADAAAEPSTEEVAKPTASGKLVDEEVRETGRVKGKVYSTYLTASGWWTWGAIMFVLLFGRTFRESSSRLWVLPTPSCGISLLILGGAGVVDRIWFKLWGESVSFPPGFLEDAEPIFFPSPAQYAESSSIISHVFSFQADSITAVATGQSTANAFWGISAVRESFWRLPHLPSARDDVSFYLWGYFAICKLFFFVKNY